MVYGRTLGHRARDVGSTGVQTITSGEHLLVDTVQVVRGDGSLSCSERLLASVLNVNQFFGRTGLSPVTAGNQKQLWGTNAWEASCMRSRLLRRISIFTAAWHARLRTHSKLRFPCLIYRETEKVKMHHVRYIRELGERKSTGFQAVMRALIKSQADPRLQGMSQAHPPRRIRRHPAARSGLRLHRTSNVALDRRAGCHESGRSGLGRAVGVRRRRAWPPTSLTTLALPTDIHQRILRVTTLARTDCCALETFAGLA
jgi:hypothetical protein